MPPSNRWPERGSQLSATTLEKSTKVFFCFLFFLFSFFPSSRNKSKKISISDILLLFSSADFLVGVHTHTQNTRTQVFIRKNKFIISPGAFCDAFLPSNRRNSKSNDINFFCFVFVFLFFSFQGWYKANLFFSLSLLSLYSNVFFISKTRAWRLTGEIEDDKKAMQVCPRGGFSLPQLVFH